MLVNHDVDDHIIRRDPISIAGWVSTSLVRKIGVGLAAMAALMILGNIGAFLQVWQQRTDAAVISVAAHQRTLSERIANRSLRAISP